MTKRGKRRAGAVQLSFVHYRTWREGRFHEFAVPACMAEPTERLVRARTSTTQAKVTCGECIAKLKEAGLWQE
jgi:hypothetical protein